MKSDHYAYGEEQADIEAIMRISAVQRWHMINTTRNQSLAEHSCNVAMLAYHVAHNAPGMFFGGGVNITFAALVHDMGEVFVGDIPSHTKRSLGVKMNPLDQLERETLPVQWHATVPAHQQRLIKICDLADGIRFIRLHGVDLTAVHARNGLERQLLEHYEKMAIEKWPTEVAVFVRQCIGFYAYENQ